MIRRIVLLFPLAALALSGCYSKITAYEGNFTIGYAAPLVAVENFVKPVAPGAKLDLHVFANGTSDKLTILEATSSKPGVLRVDAVNGTTLTVKGVSPDVTELTIAAKDASGKRVTDKMFFHVAKPALHALRHLCTEEANATYVRGSDIGVFHGLATADKRPVIGYDYAPVAIEPAGVLDFVGQPQGGTVYRYRASKTSGAVTVRSLVDETKLTLRIVDPADIDSARLDANDQMIVGGTSYAVANVELGSAPVCSQNALTRAKSLTPEICKATARLDDSLDDTNKEQLAEITGLKFGVCQIEMTLPELAGGKGITLRHSIQIGRIEFPEKKSDFPGSKVLWAFLGLAQILGITMLVRSLRRR